jgi:hypothetical protein
MARTKPRGQAWKKLAAKAQQPKSTSSVETIRNVEPTRDIKSTKNKALEKDMPLNDRVSIMPGKREKRDELLSQGNLKQMVSGETIQVSKGEEVIEVSEKTTFATKDFIANQGKNALNLLESEFKEYKTWKKFAQSLENRRGKVVPPDNVWNDLNKRYNDWKKAKEQGKDVSSEEKTLLAMLSNHSTSMQPVFGNRMSYVKGIAEYKKKLQSDWKFAEELQKNEENSDEWIRRFSEEAAIQMYGLRTFVVDLKIMENNLKGIKFVGSGPSKDTSKDGNSK